MTQPILISVITLCVITLWLHTRFVWVGVRERVIRRFAGRRFKILGPGRHFLPPFTNLHKGADGAPFLMPTAEGRVRIDTRPVTIKLGLYSVEVVMSLDYWVEDVAQYMGLEFSKTETAAEQARKRAENALRTMEIPLTTQPQAVQAVILRCTTKRGGGGGAGAGAGAERLTEEGVGPALQYAFRDLRVCNVVVPATEEGVGNLVKAAGKGR